MPKIKKLPSGAIEKIAAGEVIEDPACAVKELVENSLDANARTITVTLEMGGRNLIRVVDDGCGMDEEDAEKCLQRHATSKISSFEDLLHITSLGFRGEALPSIAAVSHLTIITRMKNQSTGTKIAAKGGDIVEIKKWGCSPGTSIEVKNLFFNTPARKKFLKTREAEARKISEILSILAISHYNICIQLIKDGRKVMDLPPSRDFRGRISKIYGNKIKDGLRPLDFNAYGVKIYGLISDPEITRRNRKSQYFFVNKRSVSVDALAFALNNSYRAFLPRGRFPLAFLFFNVNPLELDVNVHPSKREVRIFKEKEIANIVKVEIEKILGKPAFPISNHINYLPTRSIPNNNTPAASLLNLFDYNKKETPLSISEPQEPFAKEVNRPFSVTKILGQIKGLFLIVETDNGLLIIDQHAAHERILFEKILNTFKNTKKECQKLLIPEILELNFPEEDVFKDVLPQLLEIGFEISPWGERSYRIESIPGLFSGENVPMLLIDFIHDFIKDNLKPNLSLEEREKGIAASLACKVKSIKSGTLLSNEKIDALTRELLSCKNPNNCPHGRPTFIFFSEEEILKKFKRN
ncbi:MAG: DNA mismatch repair endonuclease MutL [Thermodesulfobacteriota bacterium]|nr:DNA mismatch repair endonuclease MutL [Thermodesulfobacteriota bacterium]